MSFTSISSSAVQAGQPVTNTVMGQVKDNFDDHESRLQVIESGAGTTYPPIILSARGPYYVGGAVNNVTKTTTNFPIIITGVRLLIDQAGSSGTTQVDIKVKSGVGAFTSMLTTLPAVPSSAGNDALSGTAAGSTAAVLNSSYTTLAAGDEIRLDLTSVQTGGVGFLVRIDYTGA